jgi:hypothetical protein
LAGGARGAAAAPRPGAAGGRLAAIAGNERAERVRFLGTHAGGAKYRPSIAVMPRWRAGVPAGTFLIQPSILE